MKTVAFVPIRLNSQRVAGKNLRPLDGSPLMCHILKTLTAVEGIDEVYVYCSDEGIRALLPEGVRLLRRDPSLDSDTTLGREIYDSFTAQVEADLYILAHATSPFIRAATVAEALGKVRSGEYDSAFSAEKLQTFAWFGGKPLNYAPRQHPPHADHRAGLHRDQRLLHLFARIVVRTRTPHRRTAPTWLSWTASRDWTSTTPRTSPWPKSSRPAGTCRNNRKWFKIPIKRGISRLAQPRETKFTRSK